MDRAILAVYKIYDGLRAKGYRTLKTYYVEDGAVQRFTLYTNGRTVLCLQVYKDGGCELYKPVIDDLGIDNTINAIP